MTRLSRLPNAAFFAVGLAMLAAVWLIDRLVAAQVSMAILYLLPIGLVSWFCGGAWGYAMSLLSAAAWLQVDMSIGRMFSHWFIPYWNAAVRLGFFIIVTGLSNLVSRLRRLNDQEREVSELKSAMVSLASHEFGNFLTTFKLSLTLLKESEGADPSAQRARYYATLERIYSHLNSTVANFLNLNRIESGRFAPHMRKIPIRTLIHGIVSELGPFIESKKISLRLELPAEPVPVRADPDALSVVMTNLISNAYKYTLAGGAVTVRVMVRNGAPATAEVSVEDTGIGISPADLRLIAPGSYRAEPGRKLAKGFGVGLKVVRELLASQGSRLEIESEPDRGSRFSFVLPLWSDEAAAPASDRRRNGAINGKMRR